MPTIAILGPTATGKSALAVALAREIDGEVINADALQVYRGLDIGTAKPTVFERRGVPHHLIDILEPHEAFSAGEFARRARPVIQAVRRRGRVPIVVGGSGLYHRALFEGLAPIPPVPQAVREHWRRRLERDGLEVLREELQQVDLETARRLRAHDPQRTLRALEIHDATGKTWSTWLAEAEGSDELEEQPPVYRLGLTLPRAILYDQIGLRVHRMIDEGWLEEVARYLPEEPGEPPVAFQAIGYRQLSGHLRGHCPLNQAVEETIAATRRYAKRQQTWFRRQSSVDWFDARVVKTRLSPIIKAFDTFLGS